MCEGLIQGSSIPRGKSLFSKGVTLGGVARMGFPRLDGLPASPVGTFGQCQFDRECGVSFTDHCGITSLFLVSPWPALVLTILGKTSVTFL